MEKLSLFLKLSQSVLQMNSLSNTIDDIYRTIYDVYEDISDCSIESANQALCSAYFDKSNSQIEVLDAIGHLRLAYNISEKSLNKKRNVRSFFGLIKEEENLVKGSDRFIIKECLCNLSGIISILYRWIGKQKIAEEWANISANIYSENIHLFYDFSPQTIKKDFPYYVCIKYGESEEVVETNHVTGDYMTLTKDYEYLALTPDGEAYVKSKKSKLVEQYIEVLRSIKIV